jgi:hypothetical protein
MISRTTKSVTWLWIASLFIATVGVSGTQIYCYCVGKTTLSLFSETDACQEKVVESCCNAAVAKLHKSCCENPAGDNDAQGCTKKTTKVFQLKTEFTVQEKLFEQFSLPLFVQSPLIPYLAPNALLRCPKTGYPSYAQPPPLPGRMICVRHGVFLC